MNIFAEHNSHYTISNNVGLKQTKQFYTCIYTGILWELWERKHQTMENDCSKISYFLTYINLLKIYESSDIKEENSWGLATLFAYCSQENIIM